jgi:pyruvate kinase
MAANIRAAESVVGRSLPILVDIAGPKLRIAAVAAEKKKHRLKIGDRLLLCRQLPAPGLYDAPAVTCRPESLLDSLKVGDAVSIDDGKLQGKIVRAIDDGFVVVFDQGQLRGVKAEPDKSINFPGATLAIDPITEKDRRDLDFVCANADMVGYSFVETAEDITMLQQELAKRRPDWRKMTLVAKIETPRAVRNLPEIIVRAAGQQPLAVMIARGDLGVEMGFTRLAEMQEEILWICEAAHVPAIWATQVLEGLVKKGLASRGEMTDAAMAGRAECVMLNKGPNVLAAVDVLDRLLRRMADHQIKKTPQLRILHSWSDGIPADT